MPGIDVTSMTLTGVYSGLKLNMTGASGLIASGTAVTANAGYLIARQETQGKAYNVISVVGKTGVSDPPSVVVTCDYAQEESYPEVDLDVRFTDIPNNTFLEVECSQSALSISKQQISGSSKIGSIGTDLGKFESSIALHLWVADPKSIRKTSALTLSISKVAEGGGGPVKPVLLEKFALNLAS